MPAELNFFDTYTLMAVYKRVVPGTFIQQIGQ